MNVTIYSDASICQETRTVGWAGWVKSDRGRKIYDGVLKVRTIDTGIAEAMAMVNSIHQAIKADQIKQGDLLIINTDNDSVPMILEGAIKRRVTLRRKISSGKSFRELRKRVRRANKHIMDVSSYYRLMIEENELEVRWYHVKGHRGVEDKRAAVNTSCDQRAKARMRKARGLHRKTAEKAD